MNTVNHYTDFANAEKYAKDYDAIISLGHFLLDFDKLHKCEKCGASLVIFPIESPLNTWFYENGKWVHKCSELIKK